MNETPRRRWVVQIPRGRTGDVLAFGQKIPDEFADRLRQMRAANDKQLLYATVAAAVAAGWTKTALAQPLGVTGESVRLWVIDADQSINPGPIPDPPRREAKRPKPRPLTAEEAATIREMQQAADRPGPLSEDAKQAAREYGAMLDELLNAGVSRAELAAAAGVLPGTISHRLCRYRQARRGG